MSQQQPPDGDTSATIRSAVDADAPVILRYIRGLAEYDGEADLCVATEEGVREQLFGPHPLAEALIAEDRDGPAGLALYLFYFSAYQGGRGLFLQQLFVQADRRGHGIGRAFMRRLAEIAIERGCSQVEWNVRKQNEGAIGFYERLGATFNDESLVCRLEVATLRGAPATSE